MERTDFSCIAVVTSRPIAPGASPVQEYEFRAQRTDGAPLAQGEYRLQADPCYSNAPQARTQARGEIMSCGKAIGPRRSAGPSWRQLCPSVTHLKREAESREIPRQGRTIASAVYRGNPSGQGNGTTGLRTLREVRPSGTMTTLLFRIERLSYGCRLSGSPASFHLREADHRLLERLWALRTTETPIRLASTVRVGGWALLPFAKHGRRKRDSREVP